MIGKKAVGPGMEEDDSVLEKFAKYSYSSFASYMMDNYPSLLGIIDN